MVRVLRCVRLLERLDRHGRFELLAAQLDGVAERTAVTLDDAAPRLGRWCQAG